MRTVLIIDDDPDIREVAQMSLQVGRGWQVHTAAGGASGIDQAVELRPDAILLDYMMPGMDGPTALGRLQESATTQQIPVILLTAKTDVDAEKVKSMGARGLLAKPFDPLTLAEEVERLLGWT